MGRKNGPMLSRMPDDSKVSSADAATMFQPKYQRVMALCMGVAGFVAEAGWCDPMLACMVRDPLAPAWYWRRAAWGVKRCWLGLTAWLAFKKRVTRFPR